MNKFKLTFLALMLFGAVAYESQAQDKTPFDNKELLKEVKKEKLRKPIKISEALKAYELRENAAEGKKTRATELKISQITSPTAEEGEAHIAMDPSNNNNLVMSYMNNNSATGLEFPIYTSNNADILKIISF